MGKIISFYLKFFLSLYFYTLIVQLVFEIKSCSNRLLWMPFLIFSTCVMYVCVVYTCIRVCRRMNVHTQKPDKDVRFPVPSKLTFERESLTKFHLGW